MASRWRNGALLLCLGSIMIAKFHNFWHLNQELIFPTQIELLRDPNVATVEISAIRIDDALSSNSTSSSTSSSITTVIQPEPEQAQEATPVQLRKNITAQEGWIYEPKDLDFFWKKMGDRPFIRDIYPKLVPQFSTILEVGARGYNRQCKDFLNSSITQYFQVEPFPPAVINNDGLLQCTVQEIPTLYPQYHHYFSAVLDFGVFGWDAMHRFNTTRELMDDVRKYIQGILFVLKPNGLWVLKIDNGWVPDEDAVFREFILPYFDPGNLQDLTSGVRVKNKFRFYFLYRKDNGSAMSRTSETQPLGEASDVARSTAQGIDKSSITGRNPIEVENELPGTPDWILSNPARNRQIEGYMSQTSIQRGESILLFHNTASPSVSIDVFRSGWYGGVGARKLIGPVVVPGIIQTVPIPNQQGIVACRWTDPYMVQTSESWTTGVYLVRMTEMLNHTQSYGIFVVRDDGRASVSTPPDVIFQLPVNTYQAYNFWGGKSLYSWGSGGHDNLPWGYRSRQRGAVKVSFDRPYAASNNPDAAYGNGAGEYLTNIQPIHSYPISSSAGWNYNMVRWLERNGIDTSYVTNVDIHTRFHDLAKPKVLLTQGHDEYWSWEMRENVESWRDQGVNLAFLGSNTAFMQVRFEDGNADGVVVPGKKSEPRILVCFRFAQADPARHDPQRKHLITSKWEYVKPEAELIGVTYIGDPFDTDLVVANAAHWVFNGTGLTDSDALPGLLGYEVDGIPRRQKLNPTILFKTPVVDRMNNTLICLGTIYDSPSGAFVFASGTMQWSWGLDDYNVAQGLRSSRLNPAVEVITWNLLKAAGIRSNG